MQRARQERKGSGSRGGRTDSFLLCVLSGPCAWEELIMCRTRFHRHDSFDAKMKYRRRKGRRNMGEEESGTTAEGSKSIAGSTHAGKIVRIFSQPGEKNAKLHIFNRHCNICYSTRSPGSLVVSEKHSFHNRLDRHASF